MTTAADRTLALLEAQVGRTLAEVETPVALVDLDRLEANLRRYQRYADDHGLALWPHTKTHKSPVIGLRQLELGARGLTVAKSGEAEVFQEAGAPRLLVHYPPFGAERCDRLARVAAAGVELTVAVDSVAAAEGLSAALVRHGARAAILVELDVGYHRTGVVSADAAVAVATGIARLPAVEVAGISSYPGHCHGTAAEVRTATLAVDAILRATRDAFAAAGLACDRISGGSSASAFLSHETCVNEVRPGVYALGDRDDLPPAEDGGLDACALWVLASVISDAVPGQVILDAGTKTLTSDSHDDGLHGAILELPGARLHAMNEEHGYVDVSALAERPALGDRVRIVPNHACGCVNLHDGLLAVRGGVVEAVLPVAARGLIR